MKYGEWLSRMREIREVGAWDTLAERWLQDLDRYQQQHQEERPDE